jgi:hypothetical protein
VRFVEIAESASGCCVSKDIYSIRWPVECIAPRYRELMERQVIIELVVPSPSRCIAGKQGRSGLGIEASRALKGKQIGATRTPAEKIKENAAQRAAGRKAIVDDNRRSGITTVRGIADELRERGIKVPRGDV